MGRAPAAMLLAMLLLGCRLVDQRTFEQAGLYPGAAQLQRADFALKALPPPPLATIRFGAGDTGWQPALIAASREARARKPNVVFDIVTPIPIHASLDIQDQAQKSGAKDAAAVAEVLQADGVSADQIRIGSRGDSGQPPREIEVYVR